MSRNILFLNKLREEIAAGTDVIERAAGNLDLKLLSEVVRSRNDLLRVLIDSGIDKKELLDILRNTRESDAVVRARLSLARSGIGRKIEDSRRRRDVERKYARNI